MRIVISGIPIDVQKKNIKNMHLQVKPPDGHVVISAPLSVDDKAIEAYARTQLGFIKRAIAQFQDQPRASKRQYVSGEITDYSGSSTSEEGIVGTKVIRDLRKLKDDEDVKAVVLRVNSPGGSAFASEQIWHAVKELKTEKPVIVSMGDYAASGGYYISCVADTIVAEPTTLTGSIGIFGMVPNVKELSEKIGLTYDVVKTNKFSDFGNIMRPFNQDEKTLMQMMITQGYDTFVNRCAEGRHMSKEAIEKIAEGRVWTGEAAKELGLVDVLGGIDTALEIAVRKAGIEGYTVVSYPAKQDLLSSLLNTKPTNYVESQILKSKLGEYYQQFGMLKNLKERSMIQARIPFELNIK